jgi:hypothetical protein
LYYANPCPIRSGKAILEREGLKKLDEWNNKILEIACFQKISNRCPSGMAKI